MPENNIKRCKGCGHVTLSESYKNFDLVNDLQWLKQISKVKTMDKDIKKDQNVHRD